MVVINLLFTCTVVCVYLLRALCSSCSSRLSMLRQQSARKCRSVSLGRRLWSSNRGIHLSRAAHMQSGTTTKPHWMYIQGQSVNSIHTVFRVIFRPMMHSITLTRFLMIAFCKISKHCPREPNVSKQWHTSCRQKRCKCLFLENSKGVLAKITL